jgi:hypothetical protein
MFSVWGSALSNIVYIFIFMIVNDQNYRTTSNINILHNNELESQASNIKVYNAVPM